MLHKLIDQNLGLSLSRYMRPHQLPLGLLVLILAPVLSIANSF